MKIQIIKSFIPVSHKDHLKVGDVLEVRIAPGSPFSFQRPFQVVEGDYSGEDIPFSHCITLPSTKTYSEVEYIELKQENLQRLEEVRGLMMQVDTLVEDAGSKKRKYDRLDKEMGELWNRLQKAHMERDSALATIERAMLDHQPVVLPKEVVEAIDFFKKPPQGVYTNWENETIVDCVLHEGTYSDCYEPHLAVIRTIEFDLIMKALVNGYTVEETPEDKVLGYFETITPKDWKFTGDGNDPVYIERNAIRTTCNLLGKEIDGINSKN